MRKVLKDRREVCHYWANQVQSEGRAGNVFFEGGKLYSYGRHFVIARILPNGTAVFTKQGYSSSTAQHQSTARAAWGTHGANAGGRPTVWANDADADAARNKEAAALAILAEMRASETTRRIRTATREAHKARAVALAIEFNTYLAALPADEQTASPFDVDTGSETVDAFIAREHARQKEADEKRAAALRVELDAAIKAWRAGENTRHGMHSLPPMLRLVRGKGLHTGGLLREGSADVIETSHGAEIPAGFAPALWAIVQRCIATATAYIPEQTKAPKLGHYTLKMVRVDGSIVVGCHDIAYSELQGIAAALGFTESVTA